MESGLTITIDDKMRIVLLTLRNTRLKVDAQNTTTVLFGFPSGVIGTKAELRAMVGPPQTSSSPQPFHCWPSQGGSSVLDLWCF